MSEEDKEKIKKQFQEAAAMEFAKERLLSPDNIVSTYKGRQPGGVISPEQLDFLEMLTEEIKKDVRNYVVNHHWHKKSPVVRTYERWMNGERPK